MDNLTCTWNSAGLFRRLLTGRWYGRLLHSAVLWSPVWGHFVVSFWGKEVFHPWFSILPLSPSIQLIRMCSRSKFRNALLLCQLVMLLLLVQQSPRSGTCSVWVIAAIFASVTGFACSGRVSPGGKPAGPHRNLRVSRIKVRLHSPVAFHRTTLLWLGCSYQHLCGFWYLESL